MIRKAILSDIDSIMKITDETIGIMNSENNPQWDNVYPSKEDFLYDIQTEELFVFEDSGEICGYICVNNIEPEEYDDLKWKKDSASSVVHRMAVSPLCRGKGIGTALFEYADKIAEENGTFYLKTDTYSLNDKMNYLIKKMRYEFVGNMNFKGKPENFNCYEKIVI